MTAVSVRDADGVELPRAYLRVAEGLSDHAHRDVPNF
jgi:hypothetical protein